MAGRLLVVWVAVDLDIEVFFVFGFFLLFDFDAAEALEANWLASAVISPPKNLGNFDILPPPLLMLATVTLTTIDVEGVAVFVTIFTEVGGVYVTKKVEVFVGGV